MLNRLAWYIQRFRVMETPELLHRAAEGLYIAKCQIRQLLQRQVPLQYKLAEFKFITTEPNYFILEQYFDITNDEYDESKCYLGYEWRWDGLDSSWHFAPDTKRYWPKLFFSKIDYRQGNKIGDARVVWEVSRFQRQLVEVVRAATSDRISTSEKSEVFQHILSQASSWWSANPHTIGVHYVSSMECALRLVAMTHVIDIIRVELGEEDWRVYLNFVEEHAQFIFHRLSLYSAAGNHTIAEATGLVYAGALFPEFKHASLWLDTGINLLNKELLRQIHKDGGPLEQATWYLKFIVELGVLANKVLVTVACALEEATLRRLRNAETFLGALSNNDAFNFEYGDSDHGYALCPSLKLLRLSGAPKTEMTCFPNAGVELFNLALRVRGAPRLKMIFLTKNLGMAPLFGHGHADCLSVCSKVNGHPMLIDTGTFGYNSGDTWRRYFRSVHAHNTLTVNDLDQSTQLSNFQWSEDIIAHSLVKPTKHGDYVYCSFARHHGFQSVGAIHYRAILINLLGELVVWDHVAGSGKLEVVANWHFATKVRANKRCFETNVAGINVGIKTSASATELFRESESPIAGWCSSAYGEKHGIDTLRLSERGSETVSLLTRFVFDAIDESDAWWETHIEELGKLI